MFCLILINVDRSSIISIDLCVPRVVYSTCSKEDLLIDGISNTGACLNMFLLAEQLYLSFL